MKNKGITLIALVITIIILLILAGIAINSITSENGLFMRAKQAKMETEIANIKEQIKTDILTKQVQNEGEITEENLKEILESYGTLSEEEKLEEKTLTTDKGNYEIKVSDIFNETTTKENPEEPEITKVANEPDTSGFNKNNTYYVTWDLSSSPYEIQEESNLTQTAPENWYDYTAGQNKWANIKTTGGGNDCYWVWIPRYAYKITEGYHSNSAGTIEIKFLKGTTNTPLDGSSIEIKNQTGSGNWNVHPAFWFDKNNNEIEDQGEQLAGIWVAKYEASSSSVGTINLENGTLTGDTASLNGNGGGTDTSLQVRVKPNVTSWRRITVNGMFSVCRNLTTSGNSLQGTTGIDSHMMKNTEWGAIAYLSSSIYGKTDENGSIKRIYNNPYYNNDTNCSPITGLAGGTVTQVNKGTTTNLYMYNTEKGREASTTGNVYGVYDMAGGSWEYTAAIYKSGNSNDNRSKLWDLNNLKYVDQYIENTGEQSTYYGNINKYGDAVYETSSLGNSNTSSWNSNGSYFPNFSMPVFIRGGRSSNGNSAGIFAFDYNTNETDTYNSFRPVVICSQ